MGQQEEIYINKLKTNTINPAQAAENIDNGKMFDINPDRFTEIKEQLPRDVSSISKVPLKMEQETKEYVNQSDNHLAVAQNDLGTLDAIAKRLKYYKQQVYDIPNLNKENLDLYGKKLDGTITAGELELIADQNELLGEMAENTKPPKDMFDKIENLALQTGAGVYDVARSYYDNKEIIGGAAAVGTAVGGTIGFLTPFPGGASVGARVGFEKGVRGGMMASSFIYGYTQMRNSTFKELDTAIDETTGEPIKIDPKTKAAVSYGVGLMGGLVSAGSEYVIGKANPWLNKFATGGAVKAMLKNPAVLARMTMLGNITKSALAEGGEEAIQELIQIIGVEFGKVDDTEASFLNSLGTAIEKASTMKTVERVGEAGLVGFTTGGTIGAITNFPAYRNMEQQIKQRQELHKNRSAVLQQQNKIIDTVALIKSTEMNEKSPAELKSFKDNLYRTIIGDEAYFYLEDLNEFADTPEKQQFLRETIGLSDELNAMARELNGPIVLTEDKVLALAEQDPSITDYMRPTPEAESAREVRQNVEAEETEAQAFLAREKEAETKREELMSGLGLDEELSPEQEAEIAAILNPEGDQIAANNEAEYVQDIQFDVPEELANDKQLQDLNNKVVSARIEIAKNVNAEVDAKYDRAAKKIITDVSRKKTKAEIDKNIENHKLIDRFKDQSVKTESHKRKGYSPLAIDPKSLPEDVKEIFKDNANLKKRKVFVEGGIRLEESAAIAGYDDTIEYLKVLADTPTVAEIRKQRKSLEVTGPIEEDIQDKILLSRLNARDKAFTNWSKLQLQQMKYMAGKEFQTLKRGAVKIAGRVPTIEGLNKKADTLIRKTKIKDLHPSRFTKGMDNSRKKAVKSWIETKYEDAYKQVEAAALNSELAKESLRAKDKVAKVEKFWKTVNSKSNQNALKNSGMDKAMNQFLDLYKMSTSPRGDGEIKAFKNFLKDQNDNGNYTPVVPDRLADTRQTARDMTVEQYLAVGEMGQFILHQAKLKNKLLRKAELRKTLAKKQVELRTQEMIAEKLRRAAETHPNYDPKRAEELNTRYKGGMYSVAQTILTLTSSIKTITTELDNFQVNDGIFYDSIAKPFKESYTAKRGEMRQIEIQDKETIKQYGEEKFRKLFRDHLMIPEFANITSIGNGEGRILKADLMVLQAYMGDADGRAAIPNFIDRDGNKLDIETAQAVLDRELTRADKAFVQKFLVDRFNRFTERSFELHKRTTGVEPTMVEGIPIRDAEGDLPGGYYPIKRKMTPLALKAAKAIDDINRDGSGEVGFYATLRSAEKTEQGRMKERTGGTRPLDLTFENALDFTEEFLHDLHFRETGIDVLKVLKNPTNVESMVSVVGDKKFELLLNSVKNIVSKTSEKETTLFQAQNSFLDTVIKTGHSLHAVKVIGFNLTSAMIQPDSMKNVVNRLGPKSALYLGATAKKIADNPAMYDQFVKAAYEINPDILFEQDGIDSSVVKQSYDWMPGKQFFREYNKFTKGFGDIESFIKQKRLKINDAAFSMVREGDKYNKVLATLAISEQFLNGDIEGISKEQVDAMSESERAKKLQAVVQQAVDLTLTASSPADKSVLENSKVFQLFTRFFTDRRSAINTLTHQTQRIAGDYKQGDVAKGNRKLLTLALTSGMSAAWIAAVRSIGKGETPEALKQVLKAKDADDYTEMAADTFIHFLRSPFDEFAQNTPLLDSAHFANSLDLRSDFRSITTPFTSVVGDFTMTAGALKDMLRMANLRRVAKGKAPRLSDVHQKSLVTTMGYLAGGAPSNAIFKLGDALTSRPVRKASRHIKGEMKDLNNEIDKFIKAFSDDEDAQVFIEDLKEFQKQHLPVEREDAVKLIPADSLDMIKESVSQGDWTKVNPITGATGVYQFTEKRWNELRATNPDLGLTEDGRVAKNGKEQERAMRFTNEENAFQLSQARIPVDNGTLLGAHLFGIDNYIAIHEAKNNEKLSDVVGKNSEILKEFRSVKAIKEFIADNVEINKQ